MLPIKYQGNDVYIVEATTVKEEEKFFVVRYKGKVYRWPRIHAEPAKVYGPGKFAIRTSFYHALYQQHKIKKIIHSMIKLIRNPLRRISKN